MPTILAFDCSTSPASVALRVGDRVVSESIAHGQQAAQLVPTIDRLLREAQRSYRDLASIVTTVGPGSFTGLRIALATVHGLVLAHAVPIRLLTSSEAVAWAIALRTEAPSRFMIALDAGKGEVFVQECTRGQGAFTLSPLHTAPASAISCYSIPCFSNLHAPDNPHYIRGADAAVLVRVAENIAIRPLTDAVPYYIRPADAKIAS